MNRKSFEYGRSLIKKLLLACLCCAIVSTFTQGTNASIAFASILFSMLLMAASIGCLLLYCRCPKCGKVIFLGLFRVQFCSRCKCNLITGEKGKKKSVRK